MMDHLVHDRVDGQSFIEGFQELMGQTDDGTYNDLTAYLESLPERETKAFFRATVAENVKAYEKAYERIGEAMLVADDEDLPGLVICQAVIMWIRDELDSIAAKLKSRKSSFESILESYTQVMVAGVRIVAYGRGRYELDQLTRTYSRLKIEAPLIQFT
jgi:hypothetical protein